mmetsp:Transcript_72716/g.142650  ORF Transcript_72716/g.142650 Transcript_72716/m.142650 type:complete len:115 (-) Transcript_72716:431-775(-)
MPMGKDMFSTARSTVSMTLSRAPFGQLQLGWAHEADPYILDHIERQRGEDGDEESQNVIFVLHNHLRHMVHARLEGFPQARVAQRKQTENVGQACTTRRYPSDLHAKGILRNEH